MYDRVLQGWTTIEYDLRGCGLSQRDAPSYVTRSLGGDLEAVADAAQIDRFTLLGTTLSSAPAIRYAVKHPECVARLALLTIISESTDVMSLDAMKSMASLVRTNWEVGAQTLADMGNRAGNAAAAFQLAEIYRRTTNGETVASILEDLYDTVHLRDELTKLPMPTLIMHRKAMTPWLFSAAAHAASAIPNARLVPLEGDGPTSLGEDAEANLRIVAAFLNEDPETRALPIAAATIRTPDNSFRTVLFTDLVGHTEMMSRLGDESGRERAAGARADYARGAEGARRHRGKDDGGRVHGVVRLGYEGGGVRGGVAEGVRPSSEGEALSVRVGLNAGEPIEEEGDLFGATVILASRIATKAEGGEILVADTVRGLCSRQGVPVRGPR